MRSLCVLMCVFVCVFSRTVVISLILVVVDKPSKVYR